MKLSPQSPSGASRQRGFLFPAIFAGLDIARIGLWLLVGAAIGFSIWFHGYTKGSAKLDAYKAAQATEAARIIIKRGEVTERVVTKYVQVAGKTQIVTNTVTNEVTKYADANPTGMCIDAEFVRLHDLAATNQLPKPAIKPSGIMRTTSAAWWTANSGVGAENGY